VFSLLHVQMATVCQSKSARRIAAAVIGTVILAAGCGRGESQRERDLIAQVDSLRAFIQSTRDLREDWRQRAIPILLNKYDADRFEDKGLENPLVAISKDLRSHPELIPANPVPEGQSKFGFYGDEAIHVLNDKWVLASFEDGHGTGEMILQYTVGDGGRLNWKPLLWAWHGTEESTHRLDQ